MCAYVCMCVHVVLVSMCKSVILCIQYNLCQLATTRVSVCVH